MIEKLYNENNIPIVFATDDNFVPYLYVALKSLIANSNDKNNYDIIILYSKINSYNISILSALKKSNVSIRFFDMTEVMKPYESLWYTHWNYTDAMYYRFFIADILKDYDKVLYLDGDIIFNCDVAELYETVLGDKYIAAIQDISQQMTAYIGENYRENVLHIKRENYFNTGVLLLNIKVLKNIDFLNKCLNTLKELKTPLFPDQDVLNKVCDGYVKYLPYNYNLLWNCIHYYKDAKERMPEETYKRYIEAWQSPKIIHYAGAYKPWKQPWLEYSSLFWYYARQTPFYEEVIYKNCKSKITHETIKNAVKQKEIYFNYVRCKILGMFTFGKIKEHYKDKKNRLKCRVKDYRKTLSGKL